MSINKRKTNKPAKAKVKAKSPSISQLKKKLWGIFSQYIRIKDTDLSVFDTIVIYDKTRVNRVPVYEM